MRAPTRNIPRARGVLASILALVATATIQGVGFSAGEAEGVGMEGWAFVLGEWSLVETRYGFDGEPIQTNAGHAIFEYLMSGQRIQELQTLVRDGEERTALHVFVHDPRSGELEVARTDSDHFGFSVLIGKIASTQLHLLEKHPNPESDVTRRVTYRRTDPTHFTRQLDFSTDRGESWFVRSVWNYSRE